MPSYDIALITTIEAESYDEALAAASDLAEGISQVDENVSAVVNYEYDNDGQRVLYLHPISADDGE